MGWKQAGGRPCVEGHEEVVTENLESGNQGAPKRVKKIGELENAARVGGDIQTLTCGKKG
jgi:hypothetical protein